MSSCDDRSHWCELETPGDWASARHFEVECVREAGHCGPHMDTDETGRLWWTCASCGEQGPQKGCYYCVPVVTPQNLPGPRKTVHPKWVFGLGTLLALAAACGPPPPYAKACLARPHVPVGPAVDAGTYSAMEEVLERIMVHNNIVADHEEFCARFAGVPVTVYPTSIIPCDPTGLFTKERCDGEYDSLYGIRLAASGGQFLHEMLHVYEFEHLVLNSGDHPHWEEKGYYALAAAYSSTAEVSPLLHVP